MSDDLIMDPFQVARFVFVFVNGQVLVFDADGQQITDLQGPDDDGLRIRIMLRSDEQIVWKEDVSWATGKPCQD